MQLCHADYAKTVMTTVLALLLASVMPPAASGYHLAFNEDFDHLDLSPDGAGTHTWYEGVWFDPKHAPLSNMSASASALTLAWRRNQEAPDTSITTLSRDLRHSQAWRYGYFEARMKWDLTPGAWPALWLIPVPDAKGKATYQDTEESGEIDIFEGREVSRIHSSERYTIGSTSTTTRALVTVSPCLRRQIWLSITRTDCCGCPAKSPGTSTTDPYTRKLFRRSSTIRTTSWLFPCRKAPIGNQAISGA